MDSGWSRFRALYDYEPQDHNEIAISVNDILIVAKPIADMKGWLLAQNEQTNETGDVPGTFLEYLDDIHELVAAEPAIPPPRPPKPKPVSSGHKVIKMNCTKPVFCCVCKDYAWGHTNQYNKCQDCELTCHITCTVKLSEFSCNRKKDVYEEDTYEQLVASVEEWSEENVLSWLAVTNHFNYASMFRDYGINGSKLMLLNEDSLAQMDIEDKSHQLSILYAIRELFYGDSPQKQLSSFDNFHRAPKGSYGGHDFGILNVDTLHWCDVCKKCLWGVFQQGLKCSICGLCCHPMCVTNGIPECPGRRVRGSGDDEDGVFGKDLDCLFNPAERPAPLVVVKCVQAIERRGLRVEGIYNLMPSGHGKSNLHSALNQNPSQVSMDDQEWHDPLVIATVLKMFFQELPSCLLTEDKYDEFIHIWQGGLGVDKLMQVIQQLPLSNQSVINYFMAHLYRVTKYHKNNAMTSKKLARVFSHVLLRPPSHEKLKMATNHDAQIEILNILISQGPWSQRQAEVDSQPPPVPTRTNRPKAKPRPTSQPAPPVPGSPGPSPSSDLQGQAWYWGAAKKENVEERMKEEPDGTFMVRDSRSNPGEYTLTVRKGGLSKLIRIMHQDGRYGFSDPLTFTSVIALIKFYRDCSLAEYNHKLDVKLIYPLPFCAQVEDSDSDDMVIERLENVHKELETKSHRYEKLLTEYEIMTETSNELQMLRTAHCSVIAVMEEQLSIHESFQKDAHPQSRTVLKQNYELLRRRLEDARAELSTAENEATNLSEESRHKDQIMSTLRAQIIELTSKKQDCMDYLMTRGYTQNEVKEMVNEGIRHGCIYQVPDIDLSEENWWFGKIERQEAIDLLRDTPDGTFLIRDSSSHPGSYSLTLSYDSSLRHISIKERNGCYGFNENYAIYPTLKDLVKHYHNNTLQKHNRHLATKLVYPLRFFNPNA